MITDFKQSFREAIVQEIVKGDSRLVKSVNSKLVTQFAREESFIRLLEGSLSRAFPRGWAKTPLYKGKKGNPSRIHNVVISDTHFQSLLDPHECPVGYNQITESMRLEKVATTVADYKTHYRKDSSLFVHLLGDIIQGQLHDARDGAPMAEQFAAAVHYLVELILFWAGEYPRVSIFCTPGNHGRNKDRHPDRAVHQKWDAIETMVYFSVKKAVLATGVKNVKFDISKRPYYTVQLFDSKGFFTHGDTVFKPGYPGKSINVNLLTQQAMRWNNARDVGGPFKLFVCGHVHFGSVTHMSGGVTCITNGCLVPPDPFAISIGSPDSSCGQYLFESVPGHVVGDLRYINVDGAEKGVSKNIITPYSGL